VRLSLSRLRDKSLAKQLTFDLGLRPALGRDDFLVTPSNAEAVALIDQWPDWPSHAAVLVGSPGSGKTHLAEVWRQKSHAKLIAVQDLTVANVPELMVSSALVLELLNQDRQPESALFHLLNYAKQNSGFILLTSPVWPLSNLVVPDLQSRLNALPYSTILPPDDVLLRGVLVKLFNDRQISVDEALISYLLARMPRSLDMARLLVDRIDQAALEQRVEVTRVFAGKVLAELESPEFL
jgi:chromosomal replication initiation ATPase DnaA